MSDTHLHRSQLTHSVLAFIAAAFWGLYWLPLRKIEEAGITPAWSIFAIYCLPLIFLVPLIIVRRRSLFKNRRSLSFIGLTIGAALACYATAFLQTSVLRTVLLFYMTPVWATLLSIVLLGEKIALRRWLAVATGLGGMALMLGTTDQSGTHYFGAGETIAILAGLFWALGSVLIRKSPHIDATDIVPVQYFFAMLISALFIMLSGTEGFDTPPLLSSWLNAMPYIAGFYIVIILPTIFVCIQAAQVLSPGRVGILMMSEVLVAGISAPLLAGETVSGREWIAAALIIIAGIIEVSTPALAAGRSEPAAGG